MNQALNEKVEDYLDVIVHGTEEEVQSLYDSVLLHPELQAIDEHFVKGVRAHHINDFSSALQSFQNALDISTQHTGVLLYMARTYLKLNLTQQAVKLLEHLLSLDKKNAEAWCLYAQLSEKGNKAGLAMYAYMSAIECDMRRSAFWQLFNNLFLKLSINGPMPRVRKLLIEALGSHCMELKIIEDSVTHLLKHTPEFQMICKWYEDSAINEKVGSGELFDVFEDELILAWLCNLVLPKPGIETVLTDTRKLLLKHLTQEENFDDNDTRKVLALVSALACQALMTEFVWYVSEEENAWLATCKQALSDAKTPHKRALLLAMVGCYETLAYLPNSDSLVNEAREINEPCFTLMLNRHVTERQKERECYEMIESFSEVEDETSQKVRQQYEENPYPRWYSTGTMISVDLEVLIGRLFPYLNADELPEFRGTQQDPIDVLVAGTGTGRHAYFCAMQYKNANVFAVDLSRASLAYAQMKMDEYDIGNVTLRQGDLMELPSLNKQFDVVECSGVLHHMKDPMKGWEAITKCLKPGGWMRIALYSYHARAMVREARDYIAEKGYDSSAESIRQFRHDIMNGQYAFSGDYEKWRDFYSLSECRDLLFHVQEHQYTVPKIHESVKALGLEFMGFQFSHGLDQFKNALPHIADWRSFDQWDAFEKANPHTFAEMYTFWLRKPA